MTRCPGVVERKSRWTGGEEQVYLKRKHNLVWIKSRQRAEKAPKERQRLDHKTVLPWKQGLGGEPGKKKHNGSTKVPLGGRAAQRGKIQKDENNQFTKGL